MALFAWGVLLAALVALVRRGRRIEAVALVTVVVSHWVLDVASHLPDMPVTLTGDARLVLGLWRSLPWTLAVGLRLFCLGAVLYRR